jgi:diguanylate cyclase (GGDEF)-like protein
MPSGLEPNELKQLLIGHRHSVLLSQQRATLIISRARLIAFLLAVLMPVWGVIDVLVFASPLWLGLATFRLVACAAFACLLVFCRPKGNLFDAYRAMAILLVIPTLFYVASHTLLSSYQLTGFSAVVATSYRLLPFVLIAGLAVFPLALAESLALAGVVLLAHVLAGYLSWATLDWPAFAGVFWLLLLVAGIAALTSLSQLALMIALVRKTIRDPLTGIFSRGSGQEILQLQWDTAKRHDTGLSIAFVDLDHFKSINLAFGYEAGDQVLRDYSRHLSANLRSTDTLLRWSGQEFVVIMPDTDMDQARMALARILRNGLGLRPDGQPITASIGLAERCFDFAGGSRELLEMADKRMRRAKAEGSNRLCFGTEASVQAAH